MAKRKKVQPLADKSRRPWVKRVLDRKQREAERRALQDDETRDRMLARLREAKALLGGEN